jgi:ATP phosphoribosyltransferase regulatory subunit
VEYLDSLLTGAARDLDLKTFKVVDGLSGRMMGVRADMTPQAARIDAHLINHDGVTRLCYAGSALRTKPAGFLASREPLQLGAELFGYAGIAADLEIQEILLAALEIAAVPQARLSLGHAGLFSALAKGAQLDEAQAAAMFAALRGKDVPEVAALSVGLAPRWRDAFRQLPNLYGGCAAIEQARALLPEQADIRLALDELADLLAAGNARGTVSVAVDLSDLRGDGYHNGATFAAYAGGQASAVALGGRYDGAGGVFGRSRPATGFSLDLRQILDCLAEPAGRGGILAPYLREAALQAKVTELRQAGERVVIELPGMAAHRHESGCERILVKVGQDWIVQ